MEAGTGDGDATVPLSSVMTMTTDLTHQLARGVRKICAECHGKGPLIVLSTEVVVLSIVGTSNYELGELIEAFGEDVYDLLVPSSGVTRFLNSQNGDPTEPQQVFRKTFFPDSEPGVDRAQQRPRTAPGPDL